MNIVSEAASALKGSLMILFSRGAVALPLFNLTEAGFWRSFAAFLLAAPVYLAAVRFGMPAQITTEAQRAVVGAVLIKSLAVLALQWIAWPLVMVPLARTLKLSRHYARYIIIYNWSTVIVLLMQLPPVMLYYFGKVTEQGAAFFMLVILGIVLYYRWRIARTGLEAPPLTAVMLVLMELVISLAIFRLFA